VVTAGDIEAIARNARCPCGSGLKYKRCCGTSAPPVRSKPRGAAA